ncbi:MAG: aldehyde dehydrogenase family protein, partial [Casimicrobiaceae bacterium]
MPPDTIERSSLALHDPLLLRHQCYVDGKWSDADDGGTLCVDDPATGLAVGTVPLCHGAETKRAIEAASRAYPGWRAKTARERSVMLRKWVDLMHANMDDLALILTSEQGKP